MNICAVEVEYSAIHFEAISQLVSKFYNGGLFVCWS